jgi:dynactin 1
MVFAEDYRFSLHCSALYKFNKFRGFVQQVQEQNRSLKDALEKETSKPVSGSLGVSHEMLDFKKMFAETKAHAKAIDVELRKCEVTEAVAHVKYLMAYMAESFVARGGDSEAIQALLLVPRLEWKAAILLGQVRDHCSAVHCAVQCSAVQWYTR